VNRAAVPYSLARHPFPPAVRHLTLAARTVLATAGDESFVRVRLVEARPGELAGFIAPGGGDHVRVVVSPDGGEVPLGLSGEPLGESRTETVVDHSVSDGYLDLDVLVHGARGAELGLIGSWAARAPLGSPAVVMGPKGSVVLSGAPGEVVLAGDDSALPAVRRYLRMLGPSVTGELVLETRFELASLGIEPPAGLRVSILEPDSAPSAALAAALAALPAPADPLERFVFACGEQSLVSPARAVLGAWGIDVEQAVVKGYWKR
jgi:NADPH-dependent ferric siderophore reductase